MAGQLPFLAVRLGGLIHAGSLNRTLFAAAHAFQSSATSNGVQRPFTGQLRGFADYPAHVVMGMPALSPTMSQGNIAKWKKAEGEQVLAGQILADIETDKAIMEWEAQEDGYVAKLLLPEGAKDIDVGAAALIMVEEEADIAAFKDYTPGAAAASSAPEAAPAAAAPPPPAIPASNFPPHQVLTMPALSPTMSQGNLADFKKKVGDSIAPGEIYCDVETDKAIMAWESQEEGFIAQILQPSGAQNLLVGEPVIVIVEEEDQIAAFASYTSKDAAPADAEPVAAAPEPTPAPAAAPKAAAAAPKPAAAPAPAGARVNASPYAKKLAADAGLSLAGVGGTGPGGRITASDVHAAIKSGGASAAPTSSTTALAAAAVAAAPAVAADASVPASGYVDMPHTQIRRITAQRLLESKQTIPHYYLAVECQVDAMMKLRAQINASSKSGVKISVNDFVLKAAALTLKKVPGVNATWMTDVIRQYNNVDISVAVQTPTGLMTPILKDADKKGLSAISADVKALAGKAKEGKLAPAEFMGGTFTISNLGMYGVKQFCAIVNPPQAAILAVGGSEKKVVLTGAGTYGEVSVMCVTLSCDHRVIDGAMGAQWLQAFRGYIEEPYTMLL